MFVLLVYFWLLYYVEVYVRSVIFRKSVLIGVRDVLLQYGGPYNIKINVICSSFGRKERDSEISR